MGNTIAPTKATSSLFTAARMVQPTDPTIDWSIGWALRSSCPVGGLWLCEDGDTPALNGTQEFKPDPAAVTGLRFQPFTQVQVEGCRSGVSRLPAEQADAELLAEQRLVAYTEGWVGKALAQGIGTTPGLDDSGQVVGSFTTVEDAVAAMLADWANDHIYERPIFHLPWSMASRANDPFVMTTTFADIVFNPGYPPGTMYMSGRVEISVREPMQLPADADSSVTLGERQTNRTLFIKERMAVYRFDPCLVRRASVGGS